MNRLRYRWNTRRYEMRRGNALRVARLRYRLDNMAAGRFLRVGLLVLLGSLPFILYFAFQPGRPTAVEDPVSTISRADPPQAPLVFPVETPTPSPEPSETPSPTPSPEASPTPSPTPNKPQCSNGKDDDRDGRTDFPADKGCLSRTDRSESPDPSPPPPPPPPPPNPAPAPAPPPPSPVPTTLPTPPACNDGQDNDDDGRPDYPLDRGCSSPLDDNESGEPPLPGPPPPPPPPPSPTPSPSVSPSPSPTPSADAGE